MDFCNSPEMLRLIYVLKLCIRIIAILIPIIILIMCSKDAFDTVIAKDSQSELKNKLPVMAKRLIAGIVIFFIPTLANFAFNGMLDPNEGFGECINNANLETIKLKEKEREEKLEDEKEKTQEELEEARKEQENEAQEKIEAEKKRKEEEETQQQLQQQQQQQQQNGDGYVGGVESTPVSPGVGMTSRTFKGSKTINYWELVPENISSSPALIIFLHGSGECGSMNSMINVSFPKFMKEGYMSGYDAIFLAPNTASCSWSSETKVVKELIDSTIATYNVDRSRIIITGHSLGGNGTWNMVAQYPGFFSAAVPVSGCPSANASSYVGIPIRSYIGAQESSYRSCNAGAINNMNAAGGTVEFIEVQGASHSSVINIYKDSELINWMLNQ